MPYPLLFATHNTHKVEEIKKFAPSEFHVSSLADLGWTTPIEETGQTLEANAWIKTHTLVEARKGNCFADDSGLEIEALDGQPGIFSARFAGEPVDANKNMDKVLRLMANENNRAAQFRTVIALYWEGKKYTFEGRVKGEILHERRGRGGFGYDPIFQPEGYCQSSARMQRNEKNKISHRGLAIKKLVIFLAAYQR